MIGTCRSQDKLRREFGLGGRDSLSDHRLRPRGDLVWRAGVDRCLGCWREMETVPTRSGDVWLKCSGTASRRAAEGSGSLLSYSETERERLKTIGKQDVSSDISLGLGIARRCQTIERGQRAILSFHFTIVTTRFVGLQVNHCIGD